MIFNTHNQPYSADPINFDYSVHHRIFRSVYGTLTSQYHRSGDTGQIASSWEVRQSATEWEFSIKPHLTMSDGTSVTPEVVAKSYIRLGLELKKKNSHHEFFDKLLGFDKVTSIDQLPEGIKLTENRIVFYFSAPIPRLLDYTSFGLFAIISPDDINKDGSWKDPKKIISSGAYEVKSWEENSLTIKLRDSSLTSVSSPIKDITFIFDKKDTNADIFSGTSLDEYSDEYQFIGDVYSGILYFHLFTYNDKNGPLYTKDNRLQIRQYLQNELTKKNIKLPIHFFPGMTEKDDFFKSSKHESVLNIQTRIMNTTNPHSRVYKALNQIISENKEKLKLVDIPMEEVFKHLDPNKKDFLLDLRLSSTSILMESPDEDLKFMFLSKEGICLPDPTGNIRRMLDSNSYRLADIEKQLAEDAIVFPVAHFANGLWVKKSLKLDFSQLSTIQPPVDFSFVSF